jgi:hypothetical protein
MRPRGLSFLSAGLFLLVLYVCSLGQGPTPGAGGSPSQPTNPSGTALPTALLPAGPFSFSDPTVRLPAGVQDGTTEIILRSSTEQAAAPTLTDVELPRPLAAKVTFEVTPDKTPATTWRYRAIVQGLTLATTQQHYALVTYAGNKTQHLLYTVTNQPAGAFSWSISKLPDPWVSSKGLTDEDVTCTAFTVTTKDAPATNVTVSSSLVEQTTKNAITLDSLRLCASGSKCDGTQPINVQANVPTPLQLCTTKTFHGSFRGTVVLASREKPEGETILQAAQFSSLVAKLIGFLLILLGVFLGFAARVWARARLERDQALVPVTLMRTQLTALKEALAKLKPAYRDAPSNIHTEIKTLLDDLSDNKLDSQRFLPPSFPGPFGFTVDAAGFKTYLEARNTRVQRLSMLVNEGVVPAANEDNGTLTAAQEALVVTAIKNIDAMVNTTPAPSADQVRGIVTNLHSDLTGVAQPLGAFVPTPVSRSFEVLQLEIQRISKAIWVLYGILTALSGLVVLILNNPGYGLPVDYIFAIFWGFGLPTMITSLTSGSAATALNISIAKS